MIADLNTYLTKAIPDTKLTIEKYADAKCEYLVGLSFVMRRSHHCPSLVLLLESERNGRWGGQLCCPSRTIVSCGDRQLWISVWILFIASPCPSVLIDSLQVDSSMPATGAWTLRQDASRCLGETRTLGSETWSVITLTLALRSFPSLCLF